MTNVLEWLEHMEAQSGEKNCSCRSERRIFLYSVKNVCAEGRNLSEKMDDRDCSGSNLYGKKSCVTLSIMFGAVYAGCPYCLLDLRQPEARLQQIITVLQPEVIVTKEENLEKMKKCLDAIAGDVPKRQFCWQRSAWMKQRSIRIF